MKFYKYKSLLLIPVVAVAALLISHERPQPVAAAVAVVPPSALVNPETIEAMNRAEFDSMRIEVIGSNMNGGYFVSWKDEHDLLPGRMGPIDHNRRTFIPRLPAPVSPVLFTNEPNQLGVKAVEADAEGLPPVYSLPPDEVVHPGSLAEAKADRAIDYGPKLTKAVDAWAKNKKAKGDNIKIGIFDTGCDVKHKWLAANIKGTYNAINKSRDVTDRQGHGTHVCGTILEALPNCEIYIVKVLGDNGSGSVVDIAHGLDYAIATWGIDVASFSLGGPGADSYLPASFKRADESGCIICCAAGNEGPGNNTDGYPARYVPPSLSTAACNERGEIANFSSRGASVVCNTPGVMILSALPGDKQGRMSGTSMATPLHAALAGMWVATNDVPKKDRPAKYREALRLACSHPNTRNNAEGYGLPDATKLVPADSNTPQPPPLPNPVGSINLGPTDLTADALARLKAAGITGLSLTLEYGVPGSPPAPQPMPPSPAPVPVQPAPPVVGGCPGGVCPTGYYQSAPVQQFRLFRDLFRIR